MQIVYKHLVMTAIDALDDAITEALSVLPRDLQFQHTIACRHAPDGAAAWENVRWKYTQHPDRQEEVAILLTDLVMLARAALCLRAVLLEPPTHAPDLSLPKVRRGHCQ